MASATAAELGLPVFPEHILVVTEKIPLEWAMARCSLAIHHGGPTSLAASLSAGIIYSFASRHYQVVLL